MAASGDSCRMSTRGALLLLAAALGSLAATATRAGADTVGTYQVNGSFLVQFARFDCPEGIPAATNCFRNLTVRAAAFPGLGEVGLAPYTLFWDDFGAPCPHVHAQLPVVVAGKGEIDLAIDFTACFPVGTDQFPPAAITVSGGSGRYAGASGSGLLTFHTANLTGPGAGTRVIDWTGTLIVPGLTFDTTPPQIAGASSRIVKTRLAAGTKVRYSVSATDATDGVVHTACLPRSGSRFRVGRTPVVCTAADGSGNRATARFVVTVKRVRR
jgi:hypothetical protein